MEKRTYKVNKTTKKIFDTLVEGTGSVAAAAVMMASLRSISNLNPRYLGKGMSVDKTALGLGGWTGKSKRTICERATKAGKANNNIDIQLAYLGEEILGNDKLIGLLETEQDMDKLVKGALRYYEKKRVKEINEAMMNERRNAAEFYMDFYGNKNAEDLALTKGTADIPVEENHLTYIRVTAKNGTAIRKNPSAGSQIIGKADYGDEFIWMCDSEPKGLWHKILFNCQDEGWISARSSAVTK